MLVVVALLTGVFRQELTIAERVFKQASPAIVTLLCGDAQGTGFETDVRPGKIHIVTAFHVVEAAWRVDSPMKIIVKFSDGSVGEGEIEQADPGCDLASVKVYSFQQNNVTALKYCQSKRDIPGVGHPVYVIGSPQGLELSLSEGIISGKRQTNGNPIKLSSGLVVGYSNAIRTFLGTETGLRADYLQITAPISPGSSGAPVLRSDGTVIGVVLSRIEGGENLNFAISSEVISNVSDTTYDDVDVMNRKIPALVYPHDSKENSVGEQPKPIAARIPSVARKNDGLDSLSGDVSSVSPSLRDLLPKPKKSALLRAQREWLAAKYKTKGDWYKGRWQVVCRTDAHIYASANINSKKLMKMWKGDHVVVYTYKPGWVMTGVAENKYGYMKKTSLMITSDCVAPNLFFDINPRHRKH